MTNRMLPGGASFLLHGSARLGVVLTHGFTSSPGEMRWLADDLATAGLTVYGVRLAGHATDPSDLARTRWRDWLASVHDGYHIVRGLCDRVAFVGHSMGGVLSMLAAMELPAAAAGVLASPVRMARGTVWKARWLRDILPFTDQTDVSGLVDIVKAEQARRGEPMLGRIRYDLWSTRAVGELADLVAYTAVHLSGITTPLLLVYAQGDTTVSYDQMAWIAARVSSTHVVQKTLLHGGHNVLLDVDRDHAITSVREFLLSIMESS